MSSLNRVQIIGNLGKDPEVRYTADGKTVANFSVACGEKWKDSSGHVQERTEWFKVTAWDKLGEICKQYLAKGRQVYIEGKLRTREYQDNDGNKRHSTELIASNVILLGNKPEREEIDEPAPY
jgi:single-strand DNA-binding protein